jgi:hypothetical protein
MIGPPSLRCYTYARGSILQNKLPEKQTLSDFQIISYGNFFGARKCTSGTNCESGRSSFGEKGMCARSSLLAGRDGVVAPVRPGKAPPTGESGCGQDRSVTNRWRSRWRIEVRESRRTSGDQSSSRSVAAYRQTRLRAVRDWAWPWPNRGAEVLGGTLTYRPADGGTGACFRLELPAS